jgi:ribonuclease R
VLDDYLLGRMDEDRKRYWRSRMPQAALSSSMLERRADAAERELTKLKILRWLETRGDVEYDGIITGVKQYGLFVELSGLIVEGFIHISELPWRDARFDAKFRRLTGGRGKGGSLRLGDAIVVRIKGIDLASRQMDLAFVSKKAGPVLEPPQDTVPEKRPGERPLTRKERKELRKQVKQRKQGKRRR